MNETLYRIVLLQVIRQPTNIVVKTPQELQLQKQQSRYAPQVKIVFDFKACVIVCYCFRFLAKHRKRLKNTDTNEVSIISCCVLNIYSHIYKDVFLYFFDNKKLNFVKQISFYFDAIIRAWGCIQLQLLCMRVFGCAGN